MIKADGSTTAFTGAGVTTIRCNNGTYSLTVDSDYRIDVYKLVPPTGMDLFE